MKRAMFSVALVAQLIGNLCFATTTQWFDDFDRTTMGPDWTWGPGRPAQDVAIVNGVVEITIPTSRRLSAHKRWPAGFDGDYGGAEVSAKSCVFSSGSAEMVICSSVSML